MFGDAALVESARFGRPAGLRALAELTVRGLAELEKKSSKKQKSPSKKKKSPSFFKKKVPSFLAGQPSGLWSLDIARFGTTALT